MAASFLHNLSPCAPLVSFFRGSSQKLRTSVSHACWKHELFHLSIIPPQLSVFSFLLCNPSRRIPCFKSQESDNQLPSPASFRNTLTCITQPLKFLFLGKGHAVPREPAWYVLKRFRASAAREAGGTKFQRLKDLPRKRLRNLSKSTSLVRTETGNPLENSSEVQRDEEVLSADQAIGHIVSAQANFMRVIVEKAGTKSVTGKPDDTFVPHGKAREEMEKYQGREIKVVDTMREFNMLKLKLNEGDTPKRQASILQALNEGHPIIENGRIHHVNGMPKLKQNQTVNGDRKITSASQQNLTSHVGIGKGSKFELENRYLQKRSAPAYKQIPPNSTSCGTDSSVTEDAGLLRPAIDQHASLDAESKASIELLCVVRALLKKIKQQVMVGDRVLVSGVDWADRRGMIEQVFERKSEVVDPPVANIGQMLVLFSMDRPRLEPATLSRFLVEAESTQIPFYLVLNKSDLVPHKELDAWEDRLLSWGYKPLFCSVNMLSGIVPLCDLLKNRTTIIIGPSGVGKSSLINVIGDEVGITSWTNLVVKPLEDEESADTLNDLTQDHINNSTCKTREQKGSDKFEEQMVGEVSERTGRGKHTTQNVTLLKLPIGGYLADTPGFSFPGLTKVTSKSLAKLFPEVRDKLSESESGGCAFSDCLHVGEPNCAVGGDWERYPYYRHLLKEVKKLEEMKLKAFGTKRESEVRYKVRALGIKQAEPRLNPRKHRRPSRQLIKQQMAVQLQEEVEHGLDAALEELSEQEEGS